MESKYPFILVLHYCRNNWYLPAPKLRGVERASLELLSVKWTTADSRNFTFQAKRMCS